MFHKHEWKLLSETKTESQIEHIIKISAHTSPKHIPWQMATRKHIQVFTCEKCGKLKRFVEDI